MILFGDTISIETFLHGRDKAQAERFGNEVPRDREDAKYPQRRRDPRQSIRKGEEGSQGDV
jgi:hypothetical protein